MKNKSLKVALNVSKLSVPEKINRARFHVDLISSNPVTFTNPDPTMATVTSATDDLENAWNDAENGGKTKTALMHDKEADLQKLLFDVAHYVERVADGDEEIVHLAGMSTKSKPVFHIADFSVIHVADRGTVRLRVKPQTKTIYRWEYCKDPMAGNTFLVAKTTDVCITNFSELVEGARYWFRVVFISKAGETIPYNPKSIIVI